ncbi:HYR domain-containing protein, partial [Maribellus maritimus]|uniref:HYR domain-containing protein n=1 Tax=Maribellus maritimus TaxID=2870838 RepID=UPI001EEB7FFE
MVESSGIKVIRFFVFIILLFTRIINGGANNTEGDYSYKIYSLNYLINLNDVTEYTFLPYRNQLSRSENRDTSIISCPEDISTYTDLNSCTSFISGNLEALIHVGNIKTLTWEMVGATEGKSKSTGINQIRSHTFNEGTTIITYTATDQNSNTSKCSFTVTISDNQVPVIFNFPDNIIINTKEGECYADVRWNEPEAVDNCFTPEEISWNSSHESGTRFQLGTTEVTYSFVDGIENNRTNLSFLVTVVDNESPMLVNCPPDITVYAEEGSCETTVNWVEPTANDNCTVNENLQWQKSHEPGTYFSVGTTTVTYLAEDESGNFSEECTFNVTVIDNQPPSFIAPHDLNLYCDEYIPPWEAFEEFRTAGGIASDNCAIKQNSFKLISEEQDYTNCPFTLTRTYQITDIYGNTSTTSHSITFFEPTISLKSGLGALGTALAATFTQGNVTCNGGNDGSITVSLTDIDGTYDISWSGPISNSATSQNGSNFIINNLTTGNYTITITDASETEILNVSITEPPPLSIVTQPTSLIDCEGHIVSYDVEASGGKGNYTYIWQRKTPSNGSFSNLTAGGNISFPTPDELRIENVGSSQDPDGTEYRAIISDECETLISDVATLSVNEITGLDPSYSDGSITDITICEGENFSYTVTTSGETPVSYQWKKFISTNNWGNVTNNGIISGSNSATLTFTNATPAESGEYKVTVTFPSSGADCNVTSDTRERNLTVSPLPHLSVNIPSQQICPGTPISDLIITSDIPVDFSWSRTNTANLTGIASSGSSSSTTSLTISGSLSSSEPQNLQSTTFTVTAESADGCISIITATVEVVDNTPPSITCSSNITQSTDGGNCAAFVTIPAPTTSDYCGIASTINNYNNSSDASDTYPVGTTTVEWTVTDNSGNIGTCSQTITVTDNEAPVITNCPSNITINNTLGSCEGTATWIEPSATDNCTSAANLTWNRSHIPGSTFPGGSTTVTYEVTDMSGNTSNVCSFTVTVLDQEVPTKESCPNDISVEVNLDSCDAIVNYTLPTFKDNCDGIGLTGTLVQGLSPGGSFPLGTTTVTYEYTDIANNGTASCSFDVTVIDNQKPEIICPANIIENVDPGQCQADITIPVATATDNCNVATIINDYNNSGDASDVYSVGTTTIVWVATDDQGNQGVCQQTVTIIDNEPPNADPLPNLGPFNCFDDITAANTGDITNITDNCGMPVTTTWINDSGTGDCSYSVIRTYRLEDQYGNISTIQQNILIDDTTPPTADPLPDITVDCYDDLNNAPYAENTTHVKNKSDNCDGIVTVTQHWTDTNPGGCNLTIYRYYVIEDECGNADTLVQNIFVIDTIPPTLNGIPVDETINCDEYPFTPVVTAADNCDAAPVITLDTINSTQTFNGSCTDYTYEYTLQWTATDNCGNSSTGTQIITVTDDSPPAITAPPTVIIDCAESRDTSNTGSPIAIDNCESNLIISYSDLEVPVGCGNELSITRTFTVTDVCNSSYTATVTQSIGVQDNIAPTFDNFPSDTLVSCPDNIPDIDSTITATDNCGTATVTFISESYYGLENQPGFCPTSVERIYRAEDECGNAIEYTHTITVDDDCGCSICQSSVPHQIADLRGNPDSVWIGEWLQRDGTCCDQPTNHECQSITVYLDPDAVSLIVQDVRAPSYGSETFQIDCGLEGTFGTEICVEGGGVHVITVCKPGKEKQQISITQISGAITPANIRTRVGCDYVIEVEGSIDESTVTWTDISGNGYEKYLSCTYGCLTSVFTPDSDAPTTVQYQVCGNLLGSSCIDGANACDTVTITVIPEIDILIDSVEVCEGENVSATATPQPVGTYNIYWYDDINGTGNIVKQEMGVSSSTIDLSTLPPGTYNYSVYAVEVATGLECAEDTINYNITVHPLPDIPPIQNEAICSEDSVVVDLPAGYTYDWNDYSNISVRDDSTFVFIPGSTGTFEYYVTITSEFGCETTDTFSLVVDACLECGNTTLCPADTIIITTVSDFIAAGGTVNFPCNVDDSSIDLIRSVSNNASCPETITNTYEVWDNCGNSATCEFTITRTDTNFPTVVCPDDAVLEACSEVDLDSITGLPYSATDTIITLAQFQSAGGDASDNCTYTISYRDALSGTCPTNVRRIFTVTDLCDNQVQCEQTFTINDEIPPVVNCPPDIELIACGDTDLDSLTSLPFSSTISIISLAEFIAANGSVTEDCGISQISYIDTKTGACPVTYSRSFRVTDLCGNSDACVQTITLNDTVPPEINCPSGFTLECITDIPPAATTVSDFIASGGSVSDNCSLLYESFDMVSETTTTGDCPIYVERVYSITDECGNPATCTQTFTIDDNEAPVLHDIPEDVTFECSDCIQGFVNGDFEDNNIQSSQGWDYENENDVPGWDTDSPTNNIELQRSGSVNGVISHSGNFHAELNADTDGDFYQEFCTVPTTWVQVSFWHRWRPPIWHNSNDDIMGIYVGPDHNNVSLVATVTSRANVAPDYWEQYTFSFAVPAGQTSTTFLFRAIQGAPTDNTYGNLIDDIQVVTLFDPSAIPYATDNCDAAIDLVENRIDGECEGNYQLIRTWTATDYCGNSTSATQTVTVGDYEDPILYNLPNDTTVSCNDIPEPANITATDNCELDTLVFAEFGGYGCNYTIERTWTAFDECGHSISHTQYIYVQDTSPPEITCPPDTSFQCIADIPAPDISQIIVIDSCNDATVSFIGDSSDGNTCPEVITRTYQAEDSCGNVATCTQIFTINDTIPPDFTVPPDITIYKNDTCSYDASISITGDVSDENDNCSINPEVTYSDSESVGACDGETIITRTWSVTDECGNDTTQTQIITVSDTISPVISCPPLDSIEACDISEFNTQVTFPYSETASSITVAEFEALGGTAT